MRAVRASVPPTLTRRTPRAASCSTVVKSALTTTFTGLGATARTTAAMSDAALDPGGEQAVGARVGVGLQAADRLADVGAAGDEALGSGGEHHAGPAVVDRATRRAHAVHGEREVEQRMLTFVGGVLDGEPGDPGLAGAGDVRGDLVGIGGEGALEVGAHRHLHRGGDGGVVRERFVEGGAIVATAEGPREPGARRGQGGEAELLEGDRAADVPRVGHDEAAGLVQAAELGDARTVFGHASKVVCAQRAGIAPISASIARQRGVSRTSSSEVPLASRRTGRRS